MRILVADDEPVIREYLVDMLSEMGHDVSSASNGVEALEQVRLLHPDLVISDIKMPELDGLGLLAELADEENAPEVILITGHSEMETALRAMHLGAADYLQKPIKTVELTARVNRLDRELALNHALEVERIERARVETVRQMVVTLSHEINNPLTSLQGNISYLMHCDATDEPPEEYDAILHSLQRSTRRMAELLRRLRDVEKVESVEYLPGTMMVDVEGSARHTTEKKTEKNDGADG